MIQRQTTFLDLDPFELAPDFSDAPSLTCLLCAPITGTADKAMASLWALLGRMFVSALKTANMDTKHRINTRTSTKPLRGFNVMRDCFGPRICVFIGYHHFAGFLFRCGIAICSIYLLILQFSCQVPLHECARFGCKLCLTASRVEKSSHWPLERLFSIRFDVARTEADIHTHLQ